MAFLKVKNLVISTLASGISDSDLSLTVATGEGALFPTTGDFHLSLDTMALREIVKCTSRTGDVCTIVRAQEGTAAAAHTAGKAVKLGITAGIIDQIETDFLDHDSRHSYLGADELTSIMRLLSQRAIPFVHKNWADINGFTAAHTGSGGFTTGWSYATLYTGVTNNSEGIIYGTAGFYQAYGSYGYSWGTKVSIRQGTTQTIWLGLLATPATPSLTQAHIAFYLDTSGNLWASSGNGTNGTQTDTGIDITGTTTPFLSIYADNVGIYYYVDHVLKATHLLASSYYPNAVGCYFTMYIKNATDGATRDMYCYPLNMFAMFAY